MKIKVGYAEDWTGGATKKYQIVDETISGKYVCRIPPFVGITFYGKKYLASSMSSLILIDKLSDIHIEELEVDNEG